MDKEITKKPLPPANIEVKLEGPRSARFEERDELIAMINLIFRTSVGRPATIASDWAHVYTPENLANISVISDAAQGGKLVASTGVWVCDVLMGVAKLRVGGINCVGTLPDYRRHGLGSQVVTAAQAKMRELGCQVGLLGTGITNWYRRLGWEEAGQWRTYALNRGNIGLLPRLRPGLHLRAIEFHEGEFHRDEFHKGEFDQDEVGQSAVNEALLALYHQQRMGAPRTVAGFRQRLAARSFERLFVAEEAGRPVAYLLHHPYGLLEWAGAAEDVVALARATFEALDDPHANTSQRASERRASDLGPALLRTLPLQTPSWSHPVPALLDRLRIPFNTNYLGMLYLLDPQAIVAAYGLSEVEITPFAGDQGSDKIATEDTARFRVRVGQSQVTLDRRQLTKHLFGPERVIDVGDSLFPLPFCQWYLEHV